jgi:hypothetical protein
MRYFLKMTIGLILLTICLLPVSAEDQTAAGEGLPPITIDDDPSEWQHVPNIATFTGQFNPYYFNKEVKGEMKSLPISESVFWGFNGTRIRDVKSLLATSSVYFYLSTFSPVTKGLIFFMYLHKGRESGTENEFTLEIAVNDLEGTNDVILWSFGNTNPVVVGKCRYDTNIIELEIVFSLLPEQLRNTLVKFYSLDLTSCFFDRAKGFYEEFFYTTIWFRDIPTEEDL